MPTKPSRKELSHERILDAAARALRRGGHQGVGVAEVMKDAGLTHGGFYAHFPSREAMLAEAVQHEIHASVDALRAEMKARMTEGASPLQALIETYLSERHLVEVETGCPVAALASEVPRQPDALREASRRRIGRFIDRIRQALPPGAPDDAAAVIMSTLVGTLQLARALGEEEGRSLLRTCTGALLAQYDRDDRASPAG